ncbi:DUF3325 domain-containing protein [Cupriavidus sp. 30B13]|uniref:DUF3325 domain-containing protein n=1 Tax=Cupriavidus sp. 30B13 TaxID=3384241 RepID=UPI003B90FBB1
MIANLSPLSPMLGAWSSLALCYAGMTALCLAMDRHHAQLWRREPARVHRIILRSVGWLLLMLAALSCLRGWGASIGAVVWTGSLSAAALALVGLQAWRPRAAAGLAVPAVLSGVAGLTLG